MRTGTDRAPSAPSASIRARDERGEPRECRAGTECVSQYVKERRIAVHECLGRFGARTTEHRDEAEPPVGDKGRGV